MLNVEDRVKQIKLMHVHNIFNNVGPSYLLHNMRRMNERSIQTRHSEFNYFVPTVHGIATHSVFYTSIKEWNSLPNSIKCMLYLYVILPLNQSINQSGTGLFLCKKAGI